MSSPCQSEGRLHVRMGSAVPGQMPPLGVKPTALYWSHWCHVGAEIMASHPQALHWSGHHCLGSIGTSLPWLHWHLTGVEITTSDPRTLHWSGNNCIGSTGISLDWGSLHQMCAPHWIGFTASNPLALHWKRYHCIEAVNTAMESLALHRSGHHGIGSNGTTWALHWRGYHGTGCTGTTLEGVSGHGIHWIGHHCIRFTVRPGIITATRASWHHRRGNRGSITSGNQPSFLLPGAWHWRQGGGPLSMAPANYTTLSSSSSAPASRSAASPAPPASIPCTDWLRRAQRAPSRLA